MDNGEKGAFACVDSQKQYLQEGLTKREYFAAMAMQGYISNNKDIERAIIAEWSVRMADMLLNELETKTN